jgi:hypothetical protein
MPSRKQLYWLWLGLGIALFLHGIITGGGLAGALLYWELETFNAVKPATTHALLSIPLIFAPIILLAASAGQHRTVQRDVVQRLQHISSVFLIVGSALLIIAGLAFWRTFFLPDPKATPLQIILDDLPSSAAVLEHRSVLVGTPRPQYMLGYDEVLSGRFRTTRYGHHIIPMTPSDWTPDRPVRFLVDTRGTPVENALRQTPGSQRYTTRRGLLLRNRLPAYVLAGLERKGPIIANDAWFTQLIRTRDMILVMASQG